MTTYQLSGPGGPDSVIPTLSGKLLRAVLLAVAVGFALATGAASAQADDPVAQAPSININQADAQTLAEGLKGVGLSRAEEIIRYREAFGPFASVDELADVKGIGPATVDKNRAVLTLD